MKIKDYSPMQQNQRPPARWEYRSALMDCSADLEQYGSDGWECYSVVPAAGDQAWFYFRRRVQP